MDQDQTSLKLRLSVGNPELGHICQALVDVGQLVSPDTTHSRLAGPTVLPDAPPELVSAPPKVHQLMLNYFTYRED